MIRGTADDQRTSKRDMHTSETERKFEEVKGSLDNMRYVVQGIFGACQHQVTDLRL